MNASGQKTGEGERVSSRKPPDERTVTWKITLAYDGTHFHGWQRQKESVRTIQETLEEALAPMTKDPVVVVGAGRTDAGVHASGQVASVRMRSRLRPDKMLLALGAKLPKDLSAIHVEEAPAGFSAKRHSVGKHYRYAVLNRRARNPFRAAYTWHQRQPLDLANMREAAQVLIGEHDFESFRSVHCDAAHARRLVWGLDVIEADDGEVHIDVKGNAFCRNMVRIIAGTLVDVGRGGLSPVQVEAILAAKDRTRAGMTAPAQGLQLCEVYYPDSVERAGIPEGATFPGWPIEPGQWPPDEVEPASDEGREGS